MKQVIQKLSIPDTNIESLQERRFWLQCERAYTWQPIYHVHGRLMAVELLTVVTHPDNPDLRIAPDRYFAEVAVRHRVDVIRNSCKHWNKKRRFFKRTICWPR